MQQNSQQVVIKDNWRCFRDLVQTMKKQHLPEKICPVCERPFTWRKKWERNWKQVKYCSRHCQNRRSKLKKRLAVEAETDVLANRHK